MPNEPGRILTEVTENLRQFYVKVVDGNITVGSVNADMDALDDSVMIGAQAGGASGNKWIDASSATSPSWGSANTFGFRSQGIKIQNDGNEVVEFSYDGVNKAGEVAAGASEFFDHVHHTEIYFRSASGSQTVGVGVW